MEGDCFFSKGTLKLDLMTPEYIASQMRVSTSTKLRFMQHPNRRTEATMLFKSTAAFLGTSEMNQAHQPLVTNSEEVTAVSLLNTRVPLYGKL